MQNEEEIKKITDTILKALQDAGIETGNVRVLDMKTGGEVYNVNDPVDEMIEGLKKELNLETQKEKCFCNECFNFETFEKVLDDEGGKFDYNEFTVLGKTFKVKYYQGSYGEHMIVSSAE